ncbi:MAG: hypothetical protein ABIU05_22700 [Nitrospirales bacterium]
MKFNQIIGKVSILVISILVGVLLCEAGSRLILNPADYLAPKMVKDNILGITIAPNTSGFDERGFGNKQVP